jgi:hypothetical protein
MTTSHDDDYDEHSDLSFGSPDPPDLNLWKAS